MDRKIAGHRIALGSLDIASIGAGGGSIARVDAGGILHVGPESAGAAPGPACYGQGGAEPTVTDANLVLGYLDPANFLGGARRLDESLAARAVDRIAAGLGIDRLAAARGIHRVINTNMAEGVRLESVRRGVDPRADVCNIVGDRERRVHPARAEIAMPDDAERSAGWEIVATRGTRGYGEPLPSHAHSVDRIRAAISDLRLASHRERKPRHRTAAEG